MKSGNPIHSLIPKVHIYFQHTKSLVDLLRIFYQVKNKMFIIRYSGIIKGMTRIQVPAAFLVLSLQHASGNKGI
jgi:hypothetical protein